jgi:signal peptidase I
VTPAARHWCRTGLRSLERLLAVVGLCVLVYHTCFDYGVMISGSMSPTLQGNDEATGDRVIFEKITGRFHAPRRWAIYQFHTPEGLTVAKRIVGLPGERISLRGGILCINGKPVPIPTSLSHLHYYALGNLAQNHEVDCRTGYYVLGDDSKDSLDSRYEGVLAPDRFTARAWLIIGPSGRRGLVR